MKKRVQANKTNRYIDISKKSQESIGMSFTMIFSIILMIFFVVAAFIAINYFLDMQKCTQITNFIDDFTKEVDEAWRAPRAETAFSARLPSNIEKICFANISKKMDSNQMANEIRYYDRRSNMFFYPTKKACQIPNHKINNIDIEKTLGPTNPYCIDVKNGKIIIPIKKDYNGLVCVGNNC